MATRVSFPIVLLTAIAGGCSSGSGRRDQNYGTDVGVGYVPPDGSAIADGPSSTADKPASFDTADGNAADGSSTDSSATGTDSGVDSSTDAAAVDASSADGGTD